MNTQGSLLVTSTDLDWTEDDEGLYNDVGFRDKGFTISDRKDMRRMGKRQELLRRFRPLSALSFTVLIQATWEFLLIANTQGLMDGGLAGLWWSYVWTLVGAGIVMISLAEMSSMAPTSGGQYHWVSEFAPPHYQKSFSYFTGWVSTLSWQAGTASGSFVTGTLIQAFITINHPEYEPLNWHGTLLAIFMVFILYIGNIWGAQALPLLQNLLLVVHVFGFFAVVIVLWVMSPRNRLDEVFLHFRNDGGWPTMGLSLMVGQISAIFGSLCSDATVHMAEEVKNAGSTVPTAMFWAYTANGILGLVLLATYLVCVTDIEAALSDPTAYPFIWVFRQSVSLGGVNALLAVLFALLLASSISFNASTSRQTFAFARDKGLPFSEWLGTIHPTYHVPANAIALTCVFSCLLALINIFSTTAFNAMISLQVSALMFTYMISISCVLHRRVYHPQLLPRARWSLGKWGIPINLFGVCYSGFAFFWSFWPTTTPVAVDTMNYASVLFIAVSIISIVMYFAQGRRLYSGPVVTVQDRY